MASVQSWFAVVSAGDLQSGTDPHQAIAISPLMALWALRTALLLDWTVCLIRILFCSAWVAMGSCRMIVTIPRPFFAGGICYNW